MTTRKLNKLLAAEYNSRIDYTFGDTIAADVRDNAELRNLLPEGQTNQFYWRLRKVDGLKNLYISKKKKEGRP